LNGIRLRRTIGGAMVAFFSALLGWAFSLPVTKENSLGFITTILLILIGALLAAWD